eukprot:6308730-Pyramimonas_sp.AAC.1
MEPPPLEGQRLVQINLPVPGDEHVTGVCAQLNLRWSPPAAPTHLVTLWWEGGLRGGLEGGLERVWSRSICPCPVMNTCRGSVSS